MPQITLKITNGTGAPKLQQTEARTIGTAIGEYLTKNGYTWAMFSNEYHYNHANGVTLGPGIKIKTLAPKVCTFEDPENGLKIVGTIN